MPVTRDLLLLMLIASLVVACLAQNYQSAVVLVALSALLAVELYCERHRMDDRAQLQATLSQTKLDLEKRIVKFEERCKTLEDKMQTLMIMKSTRGPLGG